MTAPRWPTRSFPHWCHGPGGAGAHRASDRTTQTASGGPRVSAWVEVRTRGDTSAGPGRLQALTPTGPRDPSLQSGDGRSADNRFCGRPLPLAQHSGYREPYQPDCGRGRVHDEDRRDDGGGPAYRRCAGRKVVREPPDGKNQERSQDELADVDD